MSSYDRELRRRRIAAWMQIAGGILVAGGGVAAAILTYNEVVAVGPSYYASRGAIMAGVVTMLIGIWKLMAAYDRPDRVTLEERVTKTVDEDRPAASITSLMGWKGFVAWRYLMDRHRAIKLWPRIVMAVAVAGRLVMFAIWREGVGEESITEVHGVIELALWAILTATYVIGVLRFSKPSLVLFGLGFVVGVGALVIRAIIVSRAKGIFEAEDAKPLIQLCNLVAMAGFGLCGLAAFFGGVRAIFTFFTTVPIGGVWIGTAALVCVLSVMSGFEADLREKILGSNAHLQITKEEGDFTEWHAAKAKIDAISGVVASTPYAISEVVVSANNNGMNVIIKGIDRASVGKVTDLVNDIEVSGNLEPKARRAEQEATMEHLEPLTVDKRDLTVPQVPKPTGGVDEPPPDMPNGGAPIDFTTPEPAKGSGSAGDAGSSSGKGMGTGKGTSGPDAAGSAGSNTAGSAGSDTAGSDTAGSNTAGSAGSAGTADDEDARPADLLTTDEKPADYSEPGSLYRVDRNDDNTEGPIRVIEPWDGQSMTARTKSLPGILVGRELMKQTHLWPQQEVRVVSPLSDPANPDATGTPIPFNRDYRIAGSFYTGMYEYDLKYVYVTLDSLQQFLDRGDSVDGIEVRVDNPDETDAYVTKIEAALGPGYRVVDWKELNRSLFSALKLEKIAMFLVLGIVILVASFSIVGNLIMVVIEKAREIALLKTLGASDWGVMQLFAVQGLMIGLVGTALGVLTGLLGCWAGKTFGLPLDPNVYYINRLPIHVDTGSVVAAALAGILISIAATLYPALLAARVRPAAGMRH